MNKNMKECKNSELVKEFKKYANLSDWFNFLFILKYLNNQIYLTNFFIL